MHNCTNSMMAGEGGGQLQNVVGHLLWVLLARRVAQVVVGRRHHLGGRSAVTLAAPSVVVLVAAPHGGHVGAPLHGVGLPRVLPPRAATAATSTAGVVLLLLLLLLVLGHVGLLTLLLVHGRVSGHLALAGHHHVRLTGVIARHWVASPPGSTHRVHHGLKSETQHVSTLPHNTQQLSTHTEK